MKWILRGEVTDLGSGGCGGLISEDQTHMTNVTRQVGKRHATGKVTAGICNRDIYIAVNM